MNLYIFNSASGAAVYGIGTYIRELTSTLKDSDINICVLNLISAKLQIRTEVIDGIRHWYFPAIIPEQRTIGTAKITELYFRNIVYLLKLHIKDKRELIFHLNYNHSSKLAEELKRAFNCKIVTVVHYLGWCFSLQGNMMRFRELLSKQITDHDDELEKTFVEIYHEEISLFEMVDYIICLSTNTKQILHNYYQIQPKKISVIYSGLTDCPVQSKLMLHKKYNIPDIPIILFAGRLSGIKGLSYALRAFRIVLNSIPNCHFFIAGDGKFDVYMKECEDIWMHIAWTGLIDREKLFDLYSIADIGVMPSFHEQCSNVAIEMMMHGVPIIASTSTGLREMIVDGITGLHIPVIEYSDKAEIDSAQLAEKIIYLLQHPKKLKNMRINARKRYEQLYSSDVARMNLLNFYNSLYAT